MGAHGSLRMRIRVLNTLHGFRFVSLSGVGQFLDALIALVRDYREPLGVARLPSAVGSQARVVSGLVRLPISIPRCHDEDLRGPSEWCASSASSGRAASAQYAGRP